MLHAVLAAVILSAPAPKLVTGNGHGFAVYDAARAAVSRFYPHPYRFRRAGVTTPSLIRTLEWDATRGAASYLDQSHVLTVDGRAAYLMPFGLERAALVATCDAARPLKVEWQHPALEPVPVGEKAWQVRFANQRESLLVRALDGEPRFGSALAGASGWAFVALAPEDEPHAVVAQVDRWQAGARPARLAAREAAELERWRARAPAGLSDVERRVWRQSESVLRMAQVREAGPARGLVLASLPDGEWFIPWVRDMAYAVVALTRMGHPSEARLGISAWMNARPVGVERKHVRDQDYQVSLVRYFGDGSEECDTSGEARPNVELDDWGLALWAMADYVERTKDTGWLAERNYRGTMYSAARDHVFRTLAACLDPAGDGLVVTRDTGLWEQNDEPYQHYASSTLAAVAGVRGFAKLARAAGDAPAAAEADRLVPKLVEGFRRTFVKDGIMIGRADGAPRNRIDGALLNALDFDVVPAPDLFARMESLVTASGGYRRVNGTTDYEAQEFVFIDVTFARMLQKSGDRARAEKLIARLTGRVAATHGLVPEMYLSRPSDAEGYEGAVDDPAGSMPMAGYGAAVLMMYWLERAW